MEGAAEAPADAESAVVRAMRAPHEPTQEEREGHEATHIPYRCWCRHCVAGRGRSEPHQTHDSDEHAFPTIAVDYVFFGKDEGDENVSPILVLKDSKAR